ncbi:hypothetical protein EIN_403380 [Entamoeba invadens IP1]|uniref:Uncharacterized protein n=1 Tax=Entamoeba invadens IP1 TaxID=370355 RepID=A0A0A1UCJ7_ENTIV|nr:hypothetical protein EIN_403380 [Entamoeba invadens IP1]ELP90014.1 hypothetical protein EIN_403380 [Entamoeba invadens IP1]|eukprot:XP_004256785.1 hypothetical protein EIN_403380 [Entamoeba invadens IP1]
MSETVGNVVIQVPPENAKNPVETPEADPIKKDITLTDIISVTDQSNKCDEIAKQQQEIKDIINDQLHHVANIQQVVNSKTKHFNEIIDQSIAIVKDTKKDLIIIQAKIQNMRLMLRLGTSK